MQIASLVVLEEGVTAGRRGAQAEEEDDAAADGHDAHLAADDLQSDRFLGLGVEGLEVGVAELALSRAGAGALGDEGDHQGKDPIEVVDAFGGLVVGEDEQAAERDLKEDRGLGEAQQIPEGNRGTTAEPGHPADRAADDKVDLGHQAPPPPRAPNRADIPPKGSGFGLLMRKSTM